MATGFSAAQMSFCSSAVWASAGWVSTGSKGSASATLAVSVSMSSGSAITTGPGRPLVATWKARETSSGMRAGSSISVAHLASGPNVAR